MSECIQSPQRQNMFIKDKKALIHFAARLGASVPMMASISSSRFTQDSRAGLAAAPLSRHLTSDLANVVETHSFVERHQVHF